MKRPVRVLPSLRTGFWCYFPKYSSANNAFLAFFIFLFIRRISPAVLPSDFCFEGGVFLIVIKRKNLSGGMVPLGTSKSKYTSLL